MPFLSFNLFALKILHNVIHYITGYFGLCVCVSLVISCQVQPIFNIEQRICVRLHRYTSTMTQGLCWTVFLSAQDKPLFDVPLMKPGNNSSSQPLGGGRVLAVLTCSLGVHDSLRDSLPVEVGHLISENHVLDQQWTSGPCSLQVQLVPHWVACSRSQCVGFLLGAQ